MIADESLDGRVVSTAATPSHFRKVSWGAVFAGMVIAVVVQLVLSLLGAGIGLSTVDPLRYNTPDASTFGLGAGIWFFCAGESTPVSLASRVATT